MQLPNDMLTTGKVRVNQERLWSDYNAQLEILLKTENEDFKKDNQQELDSCVQFRNRTCSNVKEAYCLHFANMMGPIEQKLQTAVVEFSGHKDGFIWCQHLSGAQSPCSTEAACGKRRSKNWSKNWFAAEMCEEVSDHRGSKTNLTFFFIGFANIVKIYEVFLRVFNYTEVHNTWLCFPRRIKTSLHSTTPDFVCLFACAWLSTSGE